MSFFPRVQEVGVGLRFKDSTIPVGRLALKAGVVFFEYHREFLEHGLEISPYKLPLQPGVTRFPTTIFEGLPGVFNDSLPDGWGRLLLDRLARSQGFHPREISVLDRLVHVGKVGMGALVYEPDFGESEPVASLSLDELALHSQEVLKGLSDGVLQDLIALNGSSGGARPKVMIAYRKSDDQIVYGASRLPIDFKPWLVKFANTQDGLDAGAIEYVYALMAQEAGIKMPPVHLFQAKKCAGYFAVQRFDRREEQRLHMHSVCGLLHSDFRAPSLDYEDLLTLTANLTRDVREVEKMYRLAVFNVLSHNRDDHSKNFSFLMDESGQWSLAPAYDLTFSAGPHGEQSTMVMGEGKNPGREHLIRLGKVAQIPEKTVFSILDETCSALAKWPDWASQYGVTSVNIALIQKRLNLSRVPQ